MAVHDTTACTHTHARTERHTHQQAVIVVDGRPQGVGRQPVSQNEAQGNRSEMNALEDGQTTTSNTHRARGGKTLLPAMLCTGYGLPEKKFGRAAFFFS